MVDSGSADGPDTLAETERDLAALTVLALLHTGPRDVDEMHRFAVDAHKDYLTDLPGDLVRAVDRLTRDGLAVTHDPARGVYALNADGERLLLERVHRLLAVTDRDTTLLVAALSVIGVLRPAEASEALRNRTDDLTVRLEALAADRETTAHLPAFLLVELEFEHARLTAERDWVDDLAARIERGTVTWPQIPAWRPTTESR